MTTFDYLKLLKKELNVETAYAVARDMGFSKQTVLNWQHKRGTFDDISAIKIAKVLNIPAEQILLDMRIERTKCPEAREAYKRLLKVLQGVAASIFIGVLTFSALPYHGDFSAQGQADDIYYVKSVAHPINRQNDLTVVKDLDKPADLFNIPIYIIFFTLCVFLAEGIRYKLRLSAIK